MRLMADWVLPFQGVLDIRYNRKAKCRVRVYEHEDPEAGPVVMITELADNQGEDISSAAEILVGTILATLQDTVDLSVCRSPMFINHYPPEVTTTDRDLYELLDFDQPEVLEMVVEECESGGSAESIGHRVVWTIEEAHFVPADKEMVETLLAGDAG
ncbi:MAG: hypothetical protein L0G70_05755 [Rubrobacter sp.]|nr:hypothetical protein [Rubrobacter sp.]